MNSPHNNGLIQKIQDSIIANVKIAPYITLNGKDIYFNEKKNMIIKLLSLLPVIDSEGLELDHGSVTSFLAEIVCNPGTDLRNYISWRLIDSSAAEATITTKKFKAAGIFRFNEEGKIISFETLRYLDLEGKKLLKKWLISIPSDSYKDFNGIKIPSRGEVA